MRSRVYFARAIAANGLDMGVIKIGSSTNPEQRVGAVGVQLPFHCELIASVPGDLFVERAVQMWHRADKVRGEFFHARGEVLATVAHAKATGCLPFPLTEGPGDWNFRQLNLPLFMEQRGITFKDLAEYAGANANYYKKKLELDPTGNRHILASIVVAALRKGQSVSWPSDFSFNVQLAEAA